MDKFSSQEEVEEFLRGVGRSTSSSSPEERSNTVCPSPIGPSSRHSAQVWLGNGERSLRARLRAAPPCLRFACRSPHCRRIDRVEVRFGTAFRNKEGSWNLKSDLLPAQPGTNIHMRESRATLSRRNPDGIPRLQVGGRTTRMTENLRKSERRGRKPCMYDY